MYFLNSANHWAPTAPSTTRWSQLKVTLIIFADLYLKETNKNVSKTVLYKFTDILLLKCSDSLLKTFVLVVLFCPYRPHLIMLNWFSGTLAGGELRQGSTKLNLLYLFNDKIVLTRWGYPHQERDVVLYHLQLECRPVSEEQNLIISTFFYMLCETTANKILLYLWKRIQDVYKHILTSQYLNSPWLSNPYMFCIYVKTNMCRGWAVVTLIRIS